MSKLLSILIAAVFASATFTAFAADTAKTAAPAPVATMPTAAPVAATESPTTGKRAKNAQQSEAAKGCYKEAQAKHLKGAERKAFMKDCQSNKAEATAAAPVPADTPAVASATTK